MIALTGATLATHPPGAGTLATSLPSAGTLAAGLVVALAAIAALVVVMRRHRDAFPLLAVFTLPFRLPISADGRTVNLLVPLYLVVAAGTLVHLLPRLLRRRDASAVAAAGGEAAGGRAAGAPVSPARPGARVSPTSPSWWASPRGVEWLLLITIGLYALQALYSSDRAKAAENIAFFYVPFALLFLILRDVRWTRELLLRCLGVAVALAVLFAGVGFVEYYRKALFLNPKVVAADQYDNYFRVNSVFFDPSIYGRFLALVMIAVTAVVLTGRRSAAAVAAVAAREGRRDVLVGAAVLAWLLAGLVTSFSQSSIAALLLGLAVLGAWCWGVRPTLYVSGGLLALAAAVVLLAPASLHFGLKGSSGSASNATSGRTTLISRGLELFAKHPLEGYGSGSFEIEYKQHSKASAASAENATSASHTIPVTVAAEQGIVGLAVYVALLLAAFVVLFRGAGRSPPRIAIAACFAALVLHTWIYADFLEDPFTWTLLALGVALARQDDRWAARGGVLGRSRA
ncbi:MAG: O-antigen ligase family protein [Solirubrobacteraceae bacterium]